MGRGVAIGGEAKKEYPQIRLTIHAPPPWLIKNDRSLTSPNAIHYLDSPYLLSQFLSLLDCSSSPFPHITNTTSSSSCTTAHILPNPTTRPCSPLLLQGHPPLLTPGPFRTHVINFCPRAGGKQFQQIPPSESRAHTEMAATNKIHFPELRPWPRCRQWYA